MTISDERFELNMQGLEADGLPGTAAELRARDTAQREALAQMQSERDQYDELHLDSIALADRCKAQLAEAVGLLRKVDAEVWPTWGDSGSQAAALHEVKCFLARHAQAEQQEAQSPLAKIAESLRQKAADEWASHPSNPANQEALGAQAETSSSNHELEEFEKWRHAQADSLRRCGYPDAAEKFIQLGSVHWAGWQARAALATQPAAGEPKWSCLNSWFLSLEPGRQAVLREDKWMLAGAAFDAGRQYLAPPAAAPVAAGEPLATWVALTAAGQLRKGDKIRFRFGQETLTETVALVLDAGTEREEVVYNRKRNFYFITSKALAGTSSAKEVEVLRTMAAPPAAAHGDEAVRFESAEALAKAINDHCGYAEVNARLVADRIFAAMRAQAGEGGE